VKRRGKWQGLITIARFNWPFYFLAAAVLVFSLCGLVWMSGGFLKAIFGIALVVSAYFLFVSLTVSHVIYDRSDLYRFGWLDRALSGVTMHQAISCHCGFDETSSDLREKFPEVQWVILDHYDRERMTERSIRRARAMFPPSAGTRASTYSDWPVPAGSTDVVFGILAIHELRGEKERTAWFAECQRCLRKKGRIVLVEHLRDGANFVGFGPGFWHFHSAKNWRRCWEGAGLRSIDEFCVTPFVRICVLSPS
jgi:hypothetical protein